MYATSSGVLDGSGRELVSGFAVLRRGGRLSLLLINRDTVGHSVAVDALRRGRVSAVQGRSAVLLYSPSQYVWHARGARGYPAPDRPPVALSTGPGPLRVWLPPSSLAVVSR